MKALVFIVSIFLSAVALASDIKYQSIDGIIYDQYGNRYRLEGTFEYPDRYGNMVEKNCADSVIITDPNFDWEHNWKQYPPGSMAGDTCKKVPAIGEIQINGSPSEKPKYPAVLEGKNSLGCRNFFGKALVNVWGDPMMIASHIGVSGFAVTAAPVYPALTTNVVRFYAPSEQWKNIYFKGTTNFTTGNAVANIYINFISYDKPMSMACSIC